MQERGQHKHWTLPSWEQPWRRSATLHVRLSKVHKNFRQDKAAAVLVISSHSGHPWTAPMISTATPIRKLMKLSPRLAFLSLVTALTIQDQVQFQLAVSYVSQLSASDSSFWTWSPCMTPLAQANRDQGPCCQKFQEKQVEILMDFLSDRSQILRIK